MNVSERVAKSVVEHLLPGSTMEYERHQSAGECDFDLKCSDWDAPLEVTMAANQVRLGTIGAITNNRKGGHVVAATKCAKGWRIWPLPNANINKIRVSIDTYLAQIEGEGISKFLTERPPFEHRKSKAIKELLKVLRDLGVESGCSRPDGDREIYIELPAQWGPVTPDYLQNAVALEASKDDNRKKLGATPHGEGHLFVYVDMNNFLLWKVLVDEMSPTEPPQLPPEISHVWVAAPTGLSSEYVVFRAARSELWGEPVRVVI